MFFCSDAQSCLILCDLVNCSTPDSSVSTIFCSWLKFPSMSMPFRKRHLLQTVTTQVARQSPIAFSS